MIECQIVAKLNIQGSEVGKILICLNISVGYKHLQILVCLIFTICYPDLSCEPSLEESMMTVLS